MKLDINYHHLHYFWVVAREGSVARATEKLQVAQPTISSQLKALERALGVTLFRKQGRGLGLTDAGQHILRYADQIFALGQELTDSLSGTAPNQPSRFLVGITDTMAKLVAFRLIEPVFQLSKSIKVICREDQPERLLASLALHSLDMVLTDAPLSASGHIKAYSHFLGECGLTFFAVEKLAKQYKKNFPRSLDGAPLMLPTEPSLLRRNLERYFALEHIQPNIIAELDDGAMAQVFGQAGIGIFCASSVIEKEVQKQYRVKVVGRLPQIKERFYAISLERRLRHPAVVAVSDSARKNLFE